MSPNNRNSKLLRLAVAAAASCTTCANMIAGAEDYLIVTADMKCLGTKGVEVMAQGCDGSVGQYWRKVNERQLLNWKSQDCLTVNHISGVVYTSPCSDGSNTEQVYIDSRSLIVSGGQNCVGGADCRGMCITTVGDRASAFAMETASEWCGDSGDSKFFNSKLQTVAISGIPSMVGSWVQGSSDDGSECSKKCGGGIMEVEFVCKNGAFDNAYCTGDRPGPVEIECNTQECDDWSEFGECSAKTCDEVGYHGRACLKENGNCPGKDFEECRPAGCDAEGRAEVLTIVDEKQPAKLRVAADGSLWTEFDACSNTCGVGVQTARCVDMASKAAGHPCQVYEYTQSCHDNSGPGCRYVHVEDVDGEWGPWGTCTRTCGAGVQTRQCLNRKGNGKDCGSDVDGSTRTCVNSEVCTEDQQTSMTGEAVNRVVVNNEPEAVAANGQVRSEVLAGGPQGSRVTGGMQTNNGFAVTSNGRTDEDRQQQVTGESQIAQGSNAFAYGTSYNPTAYTTPQQNFNNNPNTGFTGSNFGSAGSSSFGSTGTSSFGTTGSSGFGSTGSSGFGSTGSSGFGSSGFGTPAGTTTTSTNTGFGSSNGFGSTSSFSGGSSSFGSTSSTGSGQSSFGSTPSFGSSSSTSNQPITPAQPVVQPQVVQPQPVVQPVQPVQPVAVAPAAVAQPVSVGGFADDDGFDDFDDFDEDEFDDFDAEFDDFDDDDFFRRRRTLDTEDVLEQIDNVLPLSLPFKGVACIILAGVVGILVLITARRKDQKLKYTEGDIFQV